MALSHGKEHEKDHHQTKDSRGLQNVIGDKPLLQRRVLGVTNDEAPKHSSNPNPRASHFDHDSPNPNEPDCWVSVPGNGAILEAATGNK